MSTLFSGQNAYRHLEVLTEEIGPRHGGSENERAAAQFILEHFRDLGLDVRLEPYPIYSFEDAHATIASPDGRQIPCVAIPITAATPADGITAETLFIESADEVCLDERVRGKIVVMFNSFGGDVQGRFHALGPAGLISIQTNANQLHFRGTYKADAKRKYGSIPSVRLTHEDGMGLLQDLPEQLTLCVRTDSEQIHEGYNVVADFPATDADDDVVVMCAHYDSVWRGPGAFDNGGGIAAVMELARVCRERGSRRNLRCIAFGGEEMGLWGAKAHVKALKNNHDKLREDKEFERDGLRTELDRTRFLVNLDMMGPLYGKSNAITLGNTDIAASVRLLAKELRYPIAVKENAIYSSDNMAFNYAKVPSLSFNRCGFGNLGGHTSEDKIGNCSAEGLAHIGTFVEAWLERYVLTMHSFPFPKAFPDAANTAVKDWFKDRNPLDYEVLGPERRYSPNTDH